eukprot:Mrub_07715.p2 GENE.Mrub_07715~~Mrub_07715.p2  ORF type:complete len:281 (+),score=86.51 Mrub_07715:107-844(+)
MKNDEPEESESELKKQWAYHLQTSWPGICVEGKEQSPIDIKIADLKEPKHHLKFVYKESTQADNDSGFNRLIEGCLGEVQLKQPGTDTDLKYNGGGIWFHHPSEHSIDGVLADFELQIVHRAVQESPKEYLIISLLYKFDLAATDNDLVLKEITKGSGMNVSINLADEKVHEALKKRAYYEYDGSSTSPGCEEKVLWMVSEMVKIPKAQYEMLKLLTKKFVGKDGTPHNRLLQPINERKVYKVEI